jgi:pathogenesis-related protein 1
LGIVPLVWNSTLASYAANYAASQDKSGAGCSGALKHSGGPYGENLYWYWTSTKVLATPTQAVSAWIAEKQYYNYQTNSCATGKVCGHYTQVIWAKTRRVGCVAHNCTSNPGATFAICSYDPPGNIAGQRPY